MKLQKKRNSSNTGMPASANVRPVVHAVDWPTVTPALASATANCGFAIWHILILFVLFRNQ